MFTNKTYTVFKFFHLVLIGRTFHIVLMNYKCHLISFSFITMVISNIQEIDLPKYNYEYEPNDFRKKFIANKKQNILKNKRTKLLDKYLFNNTVYVDGIIHYEINHNNKKIKIVLNIEKEFSTVLAMEGVKYIYKRGSKWRTWRETLRDGGKNIVCYVSENKVISNCTNCHEGGYWIIENKPPCPYELFSITSDSKICAKYYTEYRNILNDCPSRIKFEDLGVSCDNPIETKWRVIRDYRIVKTFPAFICNGREYCDFITLYTIDTLGISFRMINASNNIFYSRVMRSGKNYACIDDCGYWNPNTKKIISQQNPLSFDLLGKKKKKREDISSSRVTSLNKSTKFSKPHRIKNKYAHRVDKKSTVKSAGIIPISELHDEFTTMSHCKKLEEKQSENYEDEDSDYEY